MPQQESALAYDDEDEFDDEDDDSLDSETEVEDEMSATSQRQWLTDDDDDNEKDEPEVDSAAANQRWQEFEKQDYEGQIALFLQTLEEMTLMDSEMAFSMLDKLRSQTNARQERERYEAFIEQLRQRLPKVYARHAHFYLDHFLSGMFHFLNHQPYTATATFEIIPAWLRFWEARQLLTAPLCEKTRLDLRKLNADLSKLLKKLKSAPALLTAMEGGWEKS